MSKLTVFFNCQHLAHYEFIARGQTVNQEFYLTILWHLQEAVQKEQPAEQRGWLLHHNNTPMHTALPDQKFLIKNRTLAVSVILHS
jgi:hypothetical protein